MEIDQAFSVKRVSESSSRNTAGLLKDRRKQILVYQDKGVGTFPLSQTLKGLREELNPTAHKIQPVDSYHLEHDEWEEKGCLLVIPGGRDRYYHERLQGKINQRILRFVQEGGSYLGLCAGGYYGAAFVEFEKGRELEVCEKRELAFFPGKAIGPAYGPGQFRYETAQGAKAAHIEWDRGKCYTYFNGGCYFHEPQQYSHVTVLARYSDLPETPAAVVNCQIGKGKAILSGIHPEYSSDPLNCQKTHGKEICSLLTAGEPDRAIFWRYLLSLLIY